jgi:hypothetical protein
VICQAGIVVNRLREQKEGYEQGRSSASKILRGGAIGLSSLATGKTKRFCRFRQSGSFFLYFLPVVYVVIYGLNLSVKAGVQRQVVESDLWLNMAAEIEA